jgi:hypothetical protein
MAKVPPKPSGKGMPPQPQETLGNLDKSEGPENTPLNFKVSEAFRIEFCTYAAQRNARLKQILYKAFAALKAAGENPNS